MSEVCRNLAADLADGRIDGDEMDDIFEKLDQIEGGLDAQLNAARSMGDDAKLAAALEKRNKYKNIIIKRQLLDMAELADTEMGAPHLGLQASMVGIHAPIKGAQASVDAISAGLVAGRIGGLTVDLERAGVFQAFSKMNGAFEIEVANVMADLNRAKPRGVNASSDAKAIAEILVKHQEAARQRVNRAGGYIRKLDGYITKLVHDAGRMQRAGPDKWKAAVREKLDFEAMGIAIARIEEFLDSAYDAIRSGIRLTDEVNDVSKAFKGPGNLAKKVSASRTMVFKSPDDWVSYHREFGGSNLRESYMQGLHTSARATALMTRFGTNPEAMLDLVTDKLKKKHRADPKKIKGFTGGVDNLKHQMAELTGSVNFGSHTLGAQIGQATRAQQTFAKLGGSVISAASDLAAIAANRIYQGRSVGGAWLDMLTGAVEGMVPGQKRHFMDLMGAGMESTLGGFVSRMEAHDTFTGRMGKVMHFYFKANLLGPWTDSMKRGATALISRDLALNAAKPLASLAPEMQRLLKIYDIDARQWEVARKAVREAPDGRSYLLPDEVANATGAPFTGLTRRQQQQLKDKVSENLFALLTNEADFASPSPGGRERSIMRRGYAPNTIPGQALRFMFQFKAFPITVLTKVMGRQVYGHTPGKAHISGNMGLASAIAGMSAMGFFVMQAKEVMKGRDFRPVDQASILAGMLQGGGLGIYGDFIFGQVNRFGGGTLATLAGPGLGTVASAADLAKLFRQGDAGAGDVVRQVKSNLPFANLFYAKAAMDYLVWYQMQEMVNPGYLRRMERRVKRENNQTYWMPPSSVVKRGGGFK
ncbi:MAG: hypothetical protein GY767_07995 [Shimia sp.]|nr:hypothetical protein [Shimia sp.]